MSDEVEGYRLDGKFEGAVVLYLCTDPRFWSMVGQEIDPDAFSCEGATLASRAARVIQAETGKSPTSVATILQRLMRWVSEGQLKSETVFEVDEYLNTAESENNPTPNEVLGELAPILRRRAEKRAVRTAMETYAKRGDMGEIVDLLQGASRIGASDRDKGSRLDQHSMDHIAKIRNLKRLGFGIEELDKALRGGPARTEQTVVLGGAGDGKSMFLSHAMCAGVRAGASCAYATLELGEPFVFARLIANLTGVETNDILDGHGEELAKQRLVDFMTASETVLGNSYVKQFTAHATTVNDLAAWVDDLEKDGDKIDVLIVDYGDKLAHTEKGDYTGMRQVFEGLRVLGVERNMWTLTASQATRRADKAGGKKLLDLNDGADSQHKVRVADIVITLNANEAADEMTFYIAKNRNGKSRETIGPIPTEFECARIAPVYDDAPEGWDPDASHGYDAEDDVPF